MDLVLVSITTISLVLAIAMGLIVFKLLREERQRSDARVALLRTRIAAEPSLPLHSDDAAPEQPAVGRTIASDDLFITSGADSSRPQRLAVALGTAVLVAIIGYGLVSWTSTRETSTIAKDAPPLELVRLHHTQDAASLTITGSVLNPRTGVAASNVSVAAFVYGPDGGLAGSGRAPLDYVTLGPGEESGFVVRVPVQGAVSRYRVGFRAANGQVVAHVDRRIPGSSARHTGSSSGGAPWVR